MSEGLHVSELRYPADGSVLSVDEFVVEAGEHLVLFGPNGAGKTTLLRLLAGTLEGGPPGVDASYLPQRPYMFRGSLRRTMALGLSSDEAESAMAIAGDFGVGGLLDSDANQVSGGERQRAMLAAVLARRADVVLLDEPLAALDVRDRDRVASGIAAALAGRTAVIASHDRESVAILGDRLAVLIDGAVRQSGPVGAVFATPEDGDVAATLGVANILDGTVEAVAGPMIDVRCGPILVHALGDQPQGTAVKVVFGAEAVGVFSQTVPTGSPPNEWQGEVSSIRPVGRLVDVVVDCGVPVAALVTPGALDAMALAPGDPVSLSVKATAVRVVTAAVTS